jgi:hypothetical protein
VPALAGFGIGQVGCERDGLRDETAGLEPRRGGARLARGESQAVHARIHLEPRAEHVRPAPGLEQVELERLVHEGLERVARGSFELGGVAESLQEHDARRAARLTQRQGLADARDRERVRARERLRRGR